MKLMIPEKIWERMKGYVLMAAPDEITGIGTISLFTDAAGCNSYFMVEDIFVPRQMVCQGYCETDDGAMNEIVTELLENDPEKVGNLRFRFHSHGNAAVFWSATDEEDIAKWQGPWVVNLVMNVRGDYLARLDIRQGKDVFHNIPLEVDVFHKLPPEVTKECLEEVRQKVVKLPSLRRRQWSLKEAKELADVVKGGEKNETE